MEKKKHLIIGCGTAALAALKQIRKATLSDEVKLVTMEPCLPYSPTSLPYLISGRIKESDMPLVTEAFFDEMRAEFLRGRSVSRIDTGKGEVTYDCGEREAYDTLLIATGSEPALPPIPGLDDSRVLQLRTLSDAKEVMAGIEGNKTAIILGAGLIGMHAAQSFQEKQVKARVVETLSRVLPAYFDAEASAIIRRVCERHGVEFFTDRRATGVSWKGKGVEVSLSGGEVIAADLLLVATGVRPRTSFLVGSGIAVDGGILVDSEMRTNIPNVFAAGDVACAKGFLTGSNGLNPILPNAAEQGKIAGSTMAGKKAVYDGWLPMNTFTFFGHLALSVGKAMPAGGDEVLAIKDDPEGTYRRLIVKDGRLLGAAFVDTDLNGGVIQYLIRKRVNIGACTESLARSPRETSLRLMREAENRETLSMEE